MHNFNPRPPWGGRPTITIDIITIATISIHALRGEGDYFHNLVINGTSAFQSTPSVGRATVAEINKQLKKKISIHALRGEGDEEVLYVLLLEAISIHALRGEGDSTAFPCSP